MGPRLQFLSLPNSPADDADVLILPVPYEGTVTYNKGTANGPAAILAASEQLEFFEEDMAWCPMEHMRVSVLSASVPDPGVSQKHFHEQLFETVSQLNKKSLFIALGGEHSITPEMVFARMSDGGTVIQIDAHADFRPEYHGSIYNHACPMYRIRRQGYGLIQVGIRSLHASEAKALSEDEGITTYFDRELQQPAHWQTLIQQLAQLEGDVWLTVDMDGFDPGLVAGVGTPQPGGLSWHQGLDILEAITTNPRINLCGIDMLEMIPEPSCVSDMMTAKLLQKAISYWGKANKFDQKPMNGSQAGLVDE